MSKYHVMFVEFCLLDLFCKHIVKLRSKTVALNYNCSFYQNVSSLYHKCILK